MDDEKQALTSEGLWEIGIVALAADDLVHGVADGFQALELLNLADDCRLVGVDLDSSAAEQAEKMKKANSGSCPNEDTDDRECEQSARQYA